MKIAVMGAGAVGSYFGGLLAAAGHEVTLIARGEHLRALQAKGLTLRTPEGERQVAVRATGSPAAVGPVDLVLFTVKAYDLETAAQEVAPLVGPETAIIPLLNGVDAPERLRELYGPAAMGGTCRIEAYLPEPGVVVRGSPFAELTFGELAPPAAPSPPPSPRATAILQALQAAGIDARLSADIRQALWLKLAFLAPLSALTTATGLPVGPLRENPETWRLVEAMVHEAVATGRAEGVDLPPDTEARTLQVVRSLPASMQSSMQRDRARGRRLEVEAIQGAIVRRARRLGVPAPVTSTLYALLLPFAGGGAGVG